jgi:hypothetical protein
MIRSFFILIFVSFHFSCMACGGASLSSVGKSRSPTSIDTAATLGPDSFSNQAGLGSGKSIVGLALTAAGISVIVVALVPAAATAVLGGAITGGVQVIGVVVGGVLAKESFSVVVQEYKSTVKDVAASIEAIKDN